MTDSNELPNVQALLPHDQPMVLIDNLVAIDETTIHCQVIISEQTMFFDQSQQSVGAWVGIEYMAQTVAAWSGYQDYIVNNPASIGFLLGTRRYQVETDAFQIGDTLDIFAEQLMQSDGMGAFSCTIKCNNKVLAQAQLNAFSPNETQLQEMIEGTNNG